MSSQNALTLVNPQNGNLAFKIFSFEDNAFFDYIQRNNYYSLLWIKEGNGKLKADFSEYEFSDNFLLSFSPYQPFMLLPEGKISGIALQFHPDFFCIHKHQQEVACNGVLFNNVYQPPFVTVNDKATKTLNMLIEQIRSEMQNPALAQTELLISYLKIFLITASRLKTEQNTEAKSDTEGLKKPFILQSLKEAIETHYKEKHSASDYAEILNITPKALAKITKTHLNKSLTSLIFERIIIEAKRELYLTNKPIKQIAYELGYQDEYYFSRFFKANTDISPQTYRNTVGFGRHSMLSVN
ncbi:MAG TPA: helix-turn-helix domain-containing protein [Chitinophagaceae bacterium]|nr:helix-turn-helix domain-containing protein [Chitinophagaceae bacterium]